MKLRTRLGMSVAAGVAAVITLNMAHASGSPAANSDGVIVISGSDSGQSMVAGSSTTSLGASSLAATPAGRALARSTTDEQVAVTSGAVAAPYNPRTGQILGRYRYGAGTEGQRLRLPKVLADHGSGGTGSAGGCVKVTVWQKGTSTFGTTLWTWKIWTDWCWTRSNETVAMNDTGKDWAVNDRAWEYDGQKGHHEWYYDVGPNDGNPRSAFHHDRSAEFAGPALGSFLAHEYPMNTLASYFNGTWQWWTSCCSN